MKPPPANRPSAISKRTQTGKSIHISSSFSNASKNQGSILTAQTIYAGNADVHACAARFGSGVEAEAVDRLASVDGGGDGIVMQRQNGGRHIDATAGGEIPGL